MNRLTAIFLMMCFSTFVHAKSFGVVGDVFPVAEKSFLVLIMERLRTLTENGELDAFNQQWVNRVISHTDRPAPLNLSKTIRTRLHYYRPKMILSQDITDISGRILHQKGTKVNALQSLPAYAPCWLFFNADDVSQLNWARKAMQSCANSKLILTGGSVREAEKAFEAVIYFDQGGRISGKLDIQTVPARVSRAGTALLIEELAVKENGDVI